MGSLGMLGREFKVYFEKNKLSFTGFDEFSCDITNEESCREAFKNQSFTHIINCAAFTKVDACENEQEMAYAINAAGAQNLANISLEYNIPLIHFSTDYVFDGLKEDLYIEDDEPNPISYYCLTKLESETFIKSICHKYYIFRVQWLYGEYGQHFINTIKSLAKTKDQISVVNDQRGTPTWTYSIVQQVMMSLTKDIDYGVYHLRDFGEVTWYEYAQFIVDQLNLGLNINKTDSQTYNLPAKRPLNGTLNCTKLHNAIDFKPNHWQDHVKRFLGDKI